jgi:hypothetical protein
MMGAHLLKRLKRYTFFSGFCLKRKAITNQNKNMKQLIDELGETQLEIIPQRNLFYKEGFE